MKNRVLTVATLLSFLAFPVLSRGQGKIGVINIQEAIATTQEGRKAFADIQKKYQPRQQELQRQQQEINALQDQLQKQSATLSDEERMRLSRELEDKQKMFKRATEDANADFQGDNQDAVRRIGQKMVRLLNEYAQQSGFVLVIEAAQVQPYFMAREIDLTEEIIRRYDAANPVAGADAAAPAAPPATKPPVPKPAANPATAPPAGSPKPADKPKQ